MDGCLPAPPGLRVLGHAFEGPTGSDGWICCERLALHSPLRRKYPPPASPAPAAHRLDRRVRSTPLPLPATSASSAARPSHASQIGWCQQLLSPISLADLSCRRRRCRCHLVISLHKSGASTQYHASKVRITKILLKHAIAFVSRLFFILMVC
jgi:hypothetical protein